VFSLQTGLFLSVPSGVGAAGSGAGGTLAAGTYYYVLTATNFSGETTVSAEVSAVLTGSTSSVVLTWSAVAGVGGIGGAVKIYRGTVSGSENRLIATVTSGTTFTDTGGAGVAATPPVANTAATFVASGPFTGGVVQVSGTGSTINVQFTLTA
jgi:hypothetical protein